MTYTKHLFCFLMASLLMISLPTMAAPTFDMGGLGMQLKELTQREGANKLSNAASEYVKTAQAVMGTVDSLKRVAMPLNIGTTPIEEWSPVVPKNVAKVLKENEPKLADVAAEIEKIVFIDKTTPDTLKTTKRQQGVLLLKILAYAYAAAERSLELSTIGFEENNAFREIVEKDRTVIALYQRTTILQMFSTRKISEILNLQSRLLEIDSMRGLMNKEKPADVNKAGAPKEDAKTDDKKTDASGASGSAGATIPKTGAGTGAATGTSATRTTTPPASGTQK